MKVEKIHYILSIVAVVAVAAFYHWATGIGIINQMGGVYRYFIESGDYLYHTPTYRALGYIGIVAILLFVVFMHRFERWLK